LISVIPVQFLNAYFPIDMMVSGIVILSMLSQFENAYSPIWLNCDPIYSLLKLLHSEKAYSSICVILYGITNDSNWCL
jgi:hypothetical protein